MQQHLGDMERRLENWGRWKRDGASLRSILGTRVISAIYLRGPRGPRSGNAMVILIGEAMDLDKAIERLEPMLKRVLEVRYVLRPRVQSDLWRLAGCSRATFQRRLEHARFVLSSRRYERVYENPLAI